MTYEDKLFELTNRMYRDNRISEEEIRELCYYKDMFKKAFLAIPNDSFDKFEYEYILKGTEFLEIDKEEYQMNEFAVEICEAMYYHSLESINTP